MNSEKAFIDPRILEAEIQGEQKKSHPNHRALEHHVKMPASEESVSSPEQSSSFQMSNQSP